MLKPFAVLLALFIFANQALAESFSELKVQLDTELNTYIARRNSPGISVAISLNGSVVYAGQAGFSNLELDTKVSKDSVFRIGSITKQFTAAAILKLQDAKRLDVDDAISKYLSEVPASWRDIKISDLLSHTSGLTNYTDVHDVIGLTDRPITHSEVLDLIREEKLKFKPGEKWDYTNTGYYLLGMIIEKVSGKNYGEFIEKELLSNLAQHNIEYCYTDKIVKNRASGYIKDQSVKDTVAWKNTMSINMLFPFAAGGLCATAEDLVRWNLALSSGQLISPASYESMVTNRKLNDGSLSNYGYGVGLGDGEAGKEIAHEGAIPGFRSSLVYYPEKSVVIAVLVNDVGEEARKVSNSLARHVFQYLAVK